LEDLVEAGVFDVGNHRHRRALDDSEALDDPELEELRQLARSFRTGRNDAKTRGAEVLRQFADAVARASR